MKKYIFLFVILNICAISTLHSQWLEKEGYWELEQNYGQLRDIKLNESTNELWIVTADNKVIAINVDTGLEIKRCECELDRPGYGAKISTDLLSIGIVSSFSKYPDVYDTLYYDYFNISNCLKIFSHKEGLRHLASNGGITGIEFSFFDFNAELQNFIISFKINHKYYNGPNDINDEYGITKQFNFINNQIMLVDSIDKSFSNVKYYKENTNKLYGTSNLSHSQVWSNWGGGHRISHNNFICDYDITIQNYSLLYTNSYGSSQSNGDAPLIKYGNPNHFGRIIEHGQDDFLLISQKNLFIFDKNEKLIIDSIYFKNGLYDFILHPNNEILIYSSYKSINSLLLSNKKSIESITYPFETLKFIFDNSNLNIILYCSDQKIRFISPDILKPIPDLGFIFDKQLVHTEEKIHFNAICNIDSCEYEWQFIPDGNITKTESKEIEFEYSQPGTYNVKLTIITPDGERHEFVKENIIKVIDKPKADFSYELLNDELPLKVQFTDLSKGELIDWSWDFGDGNTSAELSPIHEYKFPGDFSVKLIVKDSLDADTLVKYEIIKFMIDTITTNNNNNSKVIISTSQNQFQCAFLNLNGFNLNWTNSYFDPNGKIFLNGDYNADIYSRNYYFDFSIRDTFAYKRISDEEFTCNLIRNINFNKLILNYSRLDFGMISFNFEKKEFISNDNFKLTASIEILFNKLNNTISWISNVKNNPSVIKTDYDFKIISELSIPPNAKQYIADTINNGINLVSKKLDNSYQYFSISSENTINYEKSFSLDTNITLTNIKSVNDNLILMHGFYNDKANKTTYAYFAKYHPLDNTLHDTILYSRKDIRKIERVNNSTFAAIGQSRGRQGYLLLDTNLHQIKDVRVDSLTGEIKDMLLHDNKVYLFTEKIISLETMALGAKESYQTTASVLSLPDDILDTVKDKPIIFKDKLTHSAYPNPTSEVLNLKVLTNESANYTIKLYDIFGTELLNIHDGFISANSERIFSIPTSSLLIGSYYYVISGGGIVERGKVIIIR